MENITEWASKIDKNTRNKPNKQLQNELFRRIIQALQDNTNTYDECVEAFCRFDSKIIIPFYQDYYWTDVPNQAKWDEAFDKWATSKKPTIPATIRLALILQEKLKKINSTSEIQLELHWFSLNENERSASAFKNLCNNSKYSDLRKLLDLNMQDWKVGKDLIYKMYSILFADAIDSKTKELYQAFLMRNGLTEEKNTVSSETVKQQSAFSSDVIKNSKEVQNCDVPAKTAPTNTASVQLTASAETPVSKAHDIPKDGIALAEKMLEWAKAQTAKIIELGTYLSDSKVEASRLTKENEEMKHRITELESELIHVKKDKLSVEQQLQKANEIMLVLEAEKATAQDTINRVQLMADNSVKQELDGFKHALASEISQTAKDFESDVSDFSDADKISLYTALIEELFDKLKHHGIWAEEK